MLIKPRMSFRNQFVVSASYIGCLCPPCLPSHVSYFTSCLLPHVSSFLHVCLLISPPSLHVCLPMSSTSLHVSSPCLLFHVCYVVLSLLAVSGKLTASDWWVTWLLVWLAIPSQYVLGGIVNALDNQDDLASQTTWHHAGLLGNMNAH